MEDTEYFKNRFYVFYDYVSKTQGSVFLMEQTKEILERAYEKKDIKQLKGINKELDVWLREMFRPDEKEELSRLLQEKFGEDTKQVDLKRIEKINKIVKRGKINNKNEYELLLQRVEEIYSDDSKNEEVTELNKLLADFHKNK
jgi:hypothetical protein